MLGSHTSQHASRYVWTACLGEAHLFCIRASRMSVITVENASKSFGLKRLFTDVSFSIADRKSSRFVGSNGCGKTTLYAASWDWRNSIAVASACQRTAG